MQIPKFLITAIFLYLMANSFANYLTEVKFKNIELDQKTLATDKRTSRQRRLGYRKNYEQNYRFFKSQSTNPKINQNAASLAIYLAKKSETPEQSAEYICESHNYLKNAITSKPNDPSPILQLLELRIDNPASECLKPITEDRYPQIIRTALKNAGKSAFSMKSAITVWLKLGNTKEAIRLIKNLLKIIDRDPQIDYLVQEFLNLDVSVTDIIPNRFLQVLHWSQKIKNDLPNVLENGIEKLELIQINTLSQLKNEDLTDEQIIFKLSQLYDYAASNSVRAYIDREIIQYIDPETDSELLEFFKFRSKKNRIVSICGLTYGDSRPNDSNLIEWGADYFTHIDNDYQSVGCYTGKHAIEYFELKSNLADSRLANDDIKIFTSNDNFNWHNYNHTIAAKIVNFANNITYSFYLAKPIDSKYIKVHYQRTLTQSTFGNNLQELVALYE